MSDQVEEKVRMARLDELMQLQRKIAFAKAREYIGKRLTVYVEPTSPRKKFIVARHSRQAPQVDPVTLIPLEQISSINTIPGSKLKVQCIATRNYDLIAKPIK